MEDCKANDTADELEVTQMLWVDSRMRVDLKGVVVVCGVLEKTVEGVKHFVTEQEEEFSVMKLALSEYHKHNTRTSKDHHNPDHLLHQT